MLEKLNTKNAKKIIIILLSLFVTIALSLKLDIVNNSDISEITQNTNYFVKILLKFNYSINKDIFKSFLIFLLLVMFFKKVFFRNDIEKQGKQVFKVILSMLFAFFMVFGYSFMKINSWNMIFKNTFQLFKATIIFVGYYILFKAIINYVFDILFNKIQKQEIKQNTNRLYNFIFVKHSFIMPLTIILICWLPYIIAYYPGMIMQDSANQIRQYFGYDVPESSATNSIKLIDENVKITNHHPVLHTIILGSCVQLGRVLNNDNLGIFIYLIFQIALFSSTLAFTINFMKNLKIPSLINIFTLMMFSLLPIIPIYAVDITKDVPFVCFFIIYVIIVYNLIEQANYKKYTIKDCLYVILISVLVALFRNNGIYAIIMSLPLLIVIDRLNRKKILILSGSVIIIYVMFTNILLPVFKISPASVREALSIPFQQTARYVKVHNDEVTIEKKNIIDKVLDYDTLAQRYNPIHADAVKNKYNKDATKQDLINYFKVWFMQLLKHPTTYIQATMNNTYGYFYPESLVKSYTTDYMINSDTSLNKNNGFNYSYIKSLKSERNFIDTISHTILILPGVSWIINIAFNVWVVIAIFIYVIYIRKYRYLIYMMPFISIILVCIASPVNAYFRYSIPFIFTMPINIAILINILKNKAKCKS